MLSWRAQKHEAREEKGRKDWPLRSRDAVRSPPKELPVSALGAVSILHAIEMFGERADCCRIRGAGSTRLRRERMAAWRVP